MPPERPDWIAELEQGLKSITDRYTPDRYARTVATQRDYEQAIDFLEGDYRQQLKVESHAERRLLAKAFRDDPSLPERAERLTQDQRALAEELDRMLQAAHDTLNARFGFTRERSRDR